MIKLVVWDWNGTLFSDARAILDTNNQVLKIFGGRKIDMKTYRETIVIPADSFFIKHGANPRGLSKKGESLSGTFHSYYEKRADKVRTRKGAKEILGWLQRRHTHSIILSNHTVPGINFQLRRLHIEKYITKLLANDLLATAFKKQNKAEKLEAYLRQHKIKKSEAVIVGDSPEEVEIGRRTGITTIVITDGYYSTRRLVASKPDFLVRHLEQIKPIIQGLS